MNPDPYTGTRRSWKPKHYGFLRDLANGASKKSAWLANCGKVKAATCAANRWLAANMEAAEDWLSRLRAEVARAEEAKAVMTMLERRKYLASVVRTPLSEITEESVLCVELSQSEKETGSSRRIKKPDPLKAIELDAKLAGEWEESVKVEAGDTLAQLMQEIRSRK